MELVPDHLAVHLDQEDAAAALDQLGLDSEGLLQLRGQTDRVGLEVSLAAVGDADFHGRILGESGLRENSGIDFRTLARFSLIPAVLALAAGSCTVTVSRSDLDELLRAYEVRTAVMEPRFTVMSSFGTARTAEVADAFREDLPRVEELFGLEVDRRLQLYLLPMMKAEVAEDGQGGYVLSFADRPGYQAYTDHESRIVVLLYPDLELPNGQTISAAHDRRDYRDSLRHELSHVLAHRAAPELPTWLDEGLAHLVGRLRWFDGRPVPPRRLPLLPLDRAIPLAELLAWREDGASIVAGEAVSRSDMRRLALAFTTFLVERRPEGQPLAETVRELAATPAEELLALAGPFQRWLDERQADRSDRIGF